MALRPFTPEELQDLSAKGYDVSGYHGEAYDFPDPVTPKTSALAAGGRSALASAIPTAAGGAAFGGTMLALAPETMGTSLLAIPVAAGAGYVGSKLASKGQEALMPEKWKEQLAQDVQEHPIATTVGGLATLPLGGLNPSRVGTMAAVSGLGRKVMGLPITQLERQALINATAGASLSGIQEAVMQPLEGRDFDPGAIALNAAIGGTFTSPNAIGRKYGFHSLVDKTVNNPTRLTEIQTPQTVGQTIQPESESEVRPAFQTQTMLEAIRQGLANQGIKLPEEGKQFPRLARKAEKSAEVIAAGGDVVPRDSDIIQKVFQARQTAVEPTTTEDIVTPAETPKKPKPVKQRITEEAIKNIEAIPEENRNDYQKEVLAKWKIGLKNQEAPTTATPLQTEVQTGIEARGIAAKPTEEYTKTLTDEVLNQNNIKVSENGELKDAAGQPIKGTALLPNEVREVVTNPSIATIDTLPHEGLHYLRTELEQSAASGDKSASELLRKWDDLSKSGLEEYNKTRELVGKPPIDTHEFAVSEQGLEFVKQQFNLAGETPFKKWWNDTTSLFRTKYSNNATLQDLRRAINFRFVNEQTRGKYVGKTGPLGEVGKDGVGFTGSARNRNQEAEKSDYDRYMELQRQIGESDNLDDIQAAWKESEAIKNKNGGMPPKPPERNQTDDEGLARQGKEGKTPYPFTLKEYNKTNKILAEVNKEAREEMYPIAPKGEKERQADALMDIDLPEINQRNQGAEEGIIAELIKAAKRTEPYMEWVKEQHSKSEPVTDGEFQIALDNNQRLQDDIMSEPDVISAVSSAQNPDRPDKTLVHRENTPIEQKPVEPAKEPYRTTGQKRQKKETNTLEQEFERTRLAQIAKDKAAIGIKPYEPYEVKPPTGPEHKRTAQSAAAFDARISQIKTQDEARIMLGELRQDAKEGFPNQALPSPTANQMYADYLSERFYLPKNPRVSYIPAKTTPKPEQLPPVKMLRAETEASKNREQGKEEGLVPGEQEILDKQAKIWMDKYQYPLSAKMDEESMNNPASSLMDFARNSAGYNRMSNIQDSRPVVHEKVAKYLQSNPKWSEFLIGKELAPSKHTSEFNDLLFSIIKPGAKPTSFSGDFPWYAQSDKYGELRYSRVGEGKIYLSSSSPEATKFLEDNWTNKSQVEESFRKPGFVLPKYSITFHPTDAGISNVTRDPEVNTIAMNDPEIAQLEKQRLQLRKIYGKSDTTDSLDKGTRFQGSEEGLQDTSKQGFFRPLEGTFDKVGRVSVPIKEAFKRWETRRDQLIGPRNVAISDLQQYSRPDIERVQNLMREAYRNDKTSINVTGKDAEIAKILSGYYSKIADVRREVGLKIEGRKAGKNPMYVPDLLNDEALDTFVNKSQSPEAKYNLNEWVKYVVDESKGKISEQEARDNITAYIGALGGEKHNYLSVNFGAIRKAAGYGLPLDLRETDGVRALAKYGQRAANDLAMFTELESKPEVANVLHLRDPNTGNYHPGFDKNTVLHQATEIRDAMKWVTGGWSGTLSQSAPKVTAFVRLVNNSLLGTATGVRNIAQMPVNAVPYIHQFSDLGAAWNGLMKTRENSRDALMTAARQPQIDKLMMGELLDAPDRFTAIVRKAATAMRKWQGAEAIENISRDITFSIGKELARNNIAGAKAGNIKSQQWLKRFGTLVDEDVTKLQDAKLETALNQIGKNFTDVNQGTYGGRGLPAGIMDSQFAPFFALQKWSVEKSNVIYKDVVKPFMSGENRLPMITYVLGTALTGAAIQKLNELMTNRKGQDPTWQEALDKGDPKAVVSEMATLMQLASFGGIIGDGLKMITDVGLHGKTPRNIVSFPTATAAINFEEKTKDLLEALNQGENPWEVFKNYSLDLLTTQVQAARVLANHTVKEEDVERSDKFRDVRVFNELEGKPASEITTTNPYLGLDSKDFKRTGDLREAIGMLPGLMQRQQEKAGGSYEKLKAGMSSLKGNSYQTMPSYESQPVAFRNYYDFLVRTQGKEVADARLQDYVRQSTVNKIKSGLVPSL